MRFLVWVVVNAVALAAAAWLLDDIRVGGATQSEQAVTLLVVALVFGLVNAVVAPVAKLLSLPLVILTLGLFLVVVNALMLLLTGWISEQLGVAFAVDGFWTAVLGAIIISVATWVLEMLLRDRR